MTSPSHGGDPAFESQRAHFSNIRGGTIVKSSEVIISSNFTAEHAENAEDQISLKTLRPTE